MKKQKKLESLKEVQTITNTIKGGHTYRAATFIGCNAGNSWYVDTNGKAYAGDCDAKVKNA